MATPLRTVEFLENTAKAMPDRDIGRCNIVVCFGSYQREFTYWERHDGGSLSRLTRDEANTMLIERQQEVAR